MDHGLELAIGQAGQNFCRPVPQSAEDSFDDNICVKTTENQISGPFHVA